MKRLIFFLGLLLWSICGAAQKTVVSGTVTDAKTGEGISQASVTADGGKVTVVTVQRTVHHTLCIFTICMSDRFLLQMCWHVPCCYAVRRDAYRNNACSEYGGRSMKLTN